MVGFKVLVMHLIGGSGELGGFGVSSWAGKPSGSCVQMDGCGLWWSNMTKDDLKVLDGLNVILNESRDFDDPT